MRKMYMHTCGRSKQHHIQSFEFEFLFVLLVVDLQVSAHK